MKILIVDDEQMALEDAKDVAEKVQPEAEIFGVNTCSRALEIAEREKPDVALLDIEMPGMNGLELAKRLKEIYDSINIIFVTAYSEYALEAFSIKASDNDLRYSTVGYRRVLLLYVRSNEPCTDETNLKISVIR